MYDSETIIIGEAVQLTKVYALSLGSQSQSREGPTEVSPVQLSFIPRHHIIH